MKLKENTRFELFCRQMSDCFESWDGSIYRVTTLDYPDPVSLLSGKGSFIHGGRWNAPGSCRAVYGSTKDVTALDESRASAEYAKIPFPFRTPRLVVAIDLCLNSVVDLTAAKVRRKLGVSLEELRKEDWRKIQEQGFEAVTQALGRAAFHSGAEGIIAPSARIRKGVNVVFFPQSLGRADRAKVWDAEKLSRLSACKTA